MALKKIDYVNGAGVCTTYWKVIDFKFNLQQRYVDMTFGGWLDEECRLSNMEQSDPPRKVRCIGNRFDAYFGVDILDRVDVNPISQMYKYATDWDEFFTNAINLL